MIELSYADIVSPDFLNPLQMMVNKRLPIPVAKSLYLLAKKVNEERTLLNTLREKIESELMEEIPSEDLSMKPTMKLKEGKQAEYEKEMDELLAVKFELHGVHPFHSSKIASIDLTVPELLKIRPLLIDADELLGPLEEKEVLKGPA